MSLRRQGVVRRQALRTATAATLTVLVVLLGVLAATDLLVARNLTGGVDARVHEYLQRPIQVSSAPTQRLGDTDHDFEEPVLRWYIGRAGQVVAAANEPTLPGELRAASTPADANIAGTLFRIAGSPTADGGRLVAAASVAPVSRAMTTILIAELLVTPVLLMAVFVGALAIGRRVARPVERMRRQQLAFTADASHELRTPLSVIQAETSLARDLPATELPATVARIHDETARMRQIVDDLLWLARIDADPPPPVAKPIDLTVPAGDAAERFRAVALARSQSIEVSRTERPLLIRAPREWIDRLLGVLLDNACRYTPTDGRIEVGLDMVEGRPRLSISDSGPGIPEAERQHIFERFHRATTSGDGAGLGLAIANAVVASTRGHWEVANRSEGGARFSITWPRAGPS